MCIQALQTYTTIDLNKIENKIKPESHHLTMEQKTNQDKWHHHTDEVSINSR